MIRTTFRAARPLAVAAVAAALLPVSSASADDTGFANMHSQFRVGGKRCLLDHSHQGSSAGQPTQAAAKRAAINSWAGFTAWEYGTDWANFNKSIRRSMSCDKSGDSWECQLDATPCK